MSNKAKIREEAGKLNPIDNAMFVEMAHNREFCEEILCVILTDPLLEVLEWESEYAAVNRQGRSSRIDCVCELGDGRIVGVEVQRADNDDHQRRVRQNSALLTTNYSEPGTKFMDIPDVVFVFIAAFDIFGGNRPIYHVDRVVRETKQVVYNGFDEIYVNAQGRDGSPVSRLMAVFTEDDTYDDMFPVTSSAKRRYKLTEEGRQEMTAELEKMMDKERTEGREEGREEGRIRELISLVTDGIITIAQAANRLGESEQAFSHRLTQ